MAKHPTLADRNRAAAPAADPQANMINSISRQLDMTGRASVPGASADLRSKGRPTLADRIRVEGMAAQLGKGPKLGNMPGEKAKKRK